MRTVADQFAETLAAAGVKRVYGIVGDSLNGLTDAIRRQGKIEWVHVRHEEVAASAAAAGLLALHGEGDHERQSRRDHRPRPEQSVALAESPSGRGRSVR